MLLDNWQVKFLETKGDKLLASGRQVGKSVVCSIDASLWGIKHGKKGTNILMIAPLERQAYALYTKTLNYLLDNYKKEVVTKGKEKPTQTKFKLRNGTTFYCLPVGTGGLSVRFLTVHRLYVDEASRVNQEVYEAVYPALLTTGGETILLSTFNGCQGEFYKTWKNEDRAYDSFTRFTVSSVDVMNERAISDDWTQLTKDKAILRLQREKLRLSNKIFSQEYLGVPTEDSFKFFPAELINKCCKLLRPEKVDTQTRHILGVDLARMGEDKSSFSVIKKIDRDNFQHVEQISTAKTVMTQTFDLILQLNEKWNCKKIGIDSGSGSMGVGLMDFLLRKDEVRHRVVALNNAKRALNYGGEKSTRLLKEDMYQNLKAMMEQGTIMLLDDDEVIESLESVQFDVKLKEGEINNAIWSHTNSDIVEALIRASWLSY